MHKHADRDAGTINAIGREATWEPTPGRAGILAGLAVFAAVYLAVLQQFGIVAGIGLGWLPAGAGAWLTAVAISFLAGCAQREAALPDDRAAAPSPRRLGPDALQ